MSDGARPPSHGGQATDRPAHWSGKLLALDVGQARIGVAVCDPLQLSARPLLTLQRRSREQDLARIAELVVQQEVTAVICGLPLNMDGSEGQQAQFVRRWAGRLADGLLMRLDRAVPVVLADERLSTFAAQEILAGSKRAMEEDAAAAAVILQEFLDGQRRGDLPTLGVIVPSTTSIDTSGNATS